jgi:hypothetical protein
MNWQGGICCNRFPIKAFDTLDITIHYPTKSAGWNGGYNVFQEWTGYKDAWKKEPVFRVGYVRKNRRRVAYAEAWVFEISQL